MKLQYHRNMVRKALTSAGFGPKCIECAVEGNEDQDGPCGQDNTEYHFDGCDFQGGIRYIRSQWQAIDDLIASDCKGNLCNILKAWGRLSHAVQDFYAHSNWIELGNKEIWNLELDKLPDRIVSGLWVVSRFVCVIEGKQCPTHGVLIHDADDISKDEPGRPGFGKAIRLAYKHSRALAEELKAKIPKDCLKGCG